MAIHNDEGPWPIVEALGTLLEPHPAYVERVKQKPPKKPEEVFKVARYRFQCEDCGISGIGWVNASSAIAEAVAHKDGRCK